MLLTSMLRIGTWSGALFLASCATLPSAHRDRAGTPAAWENRLEAAVPRLMEEARVPGVSIAVAADGSVWYRVFGVANAQTKVAVTHDTIFEAASISKPTFAYAVLKMADEAMLDLDRPLLNYVAPDNIDLIVQRRVRDGRLSLVTARMVLSHTSGFPHAAEAGAERVLEFGPGSKRPLR